MTGLLSRKAQLLLTGRAARPKFTAGLPQNEV